MPAGTLDLLMHLSSSSSPQHDYNSGSCAPPYNSTVVTCEQLKSSAAVLPPSAPFHHLHDLHHQPSPVHVNVQLARETEGYCSSVAASTIKISALTAPLWTSSSSCNRGGQPHQGTILTQQLTTMRPSKSTPIFNEAQLTIFYSGTVNVYNDVPADKAEAIKVLAARSRNFPVINDNLIADCNIKPDPFNSKAANLNAGSPGINSINTKSPALSSNTSINTQRPRRSHIELPYARTVSLARFLGKRRERVQAKAAGVVRLSGKIDHEDKVTPPES